MENPTMVFDLRVYLFSPMSVSTHANTGFFLGERIWVRHYPCTWSLCDLLILNLNLKQRNRTRVAEDFPRNWVAVSYNIFEEYQYGILAPE